MINIDEKTYSRIIKLKNLAERGVGGEKESAQKKLKEILIANKISCIEELNENNIEVNFFDTKNKYEKQIFAQICFKKFNGDRERCCFYNKPDDRNRVGIYCTQAEKVELELEFEFYRDLYYDELEYFTNAFIQAQELFPDVPSSSANINESKEDVIKIISLANQIEHRTRHFAIENKGDNYGDNYGKSL